MLAEANGKQEQPASEKEKEKERERKRTNVIPLPPFRKSTACKNILSQSRGIIIPASEKTEAVIRTENIILKAILEMEI